MIKHDFFEKESLLQKQQEEPERDEDYLLTCCDYLFLKHILSHDYPKVQVEYVHAFDEPSRIG